MGLGTVFPKVDGHLGRGEVASVEQEREQGQGKKARERFLRVKQTGNLFYPPHFLCARTPMQRPPSSQIGLRVSPPLPFPGASSMVLFAHKSLSSQLHWKLRAEAGALTFAASSLPGWLERAEWAGEKAWSLKTCV